MDHSVLLSFFVFPSHSHSPPDGFGNNAGRPLAGASRAYFRDLYCFQSRSSAACLTRRPCLVCHCMSRPISCPACQGRPQAESLAGRWGRVLARAVGWVRLRVTRIAGMHFSRNSGGGSVFPLPLSSRKRGWVNTLTPQIFQNIFSCPAGSGPCA